MLKSSALLDATPLVTPGGWIHTRGVWSDVMCTVFRGTYSDVVCVCSGSLLVLHQQELGLV